MNPNFGLTDREWRQYLDSQYWISEFGDVGTVRYRSWAGKQKILKTPLDAKGYPEVLVYLHGKLFHKRVYRLVAEVFLGPPTDPTKTWVLHRDDNKQNNHFTNLYYGDRLDNAKDRNVNGHSQQGETHSGAVLTALQVREVKVRLSVGESLDLISEEMSIEKRRLYKIKQGTLWKSVKAFK